MSNQHYPHDTCALCDVPLTERSRSQEHIIANAIGGRLKTGAVLCKSCNGQAGHRWDADLAEELQTLSVLLNVRRERKAVQAVTLRTQAGHDIRMGPNGAITVPLRASPIVHEETESGRRFIIRADDQKGFVKAVAGIKRRNPAFDAEAALSSAEVVRVSHSGIAQIEFRDTVSSGGARLSVVKAALCMAVDAGVPHQHCPEVRAALRGNRDTIPLWRMHSLDLVPNRDSSLPMHCVGVMALPERRLLLGYVELFSLVRLVLVLARDYAGPAVTRAHAINPAKGMVLRHGADLRFRQIDLVRLEAGGYADETAWASWLGPLFEPAVEARQRAECEFVLRELKADVMEEMGCGRAGPVPASQLGHFRVLFEARVQALADKEEAFARHLLRMAVVNPTGGQ